MRCKKCGNPRMYRVTGSDEGDYYECRALDVKTDDICWNIQELDGTIVL